MLKTSKTLNSSRFAALGFCLMLLLSACSKQKQSGYSSPPSTPSAEEQLDHYRKTGWPGLDETVKPLRQGEWWQVEIDQAIVMFNGYLEGPDSPLWAYKLKLKIKYLGPAGPNVAVPYPYVTNESESYKQFPGAFSHPPDESEFRALKTGETFDKEYEFIDKRPPEKPKLGFGSIQPFPFNWTGFEHPKS